VKGSEVGEHFILKGFPITERLRLEEIFPKKRPLEVELGAGDGSFLVSYAKVHPELNLIGVERLLGRLRKIGRKAHRAGLENIRVLRLEAAYFVQYLLPPGSVSSFHIYFPDPWPKRRHWKNRLVNESFTELLRGALVKGGVVHLRTDDDAYFAQMLKVFAKNPNFTKIRTEAGLLAVETDFERGFKQRGVATKHASYQRAI
jgi:tRNA (guanine-N7-)-methyltransferase